MDASLQIQRRKIINEVINIEGGFSDNPADSGGATKFGITHQTASKHGYGVRSLTKDQAYQIYESDYWEPLQLDLICPISEKICGELFDTAVNTGVFRAGTFLQRALSAMNNGGQIYGDLVTDGDIGKNTLDALRAYMQHRGKRGEHVLFNLLNSMQGTFYLELAEKRPKDEAFMFGWQSNRVGLMDKGQLDQSESLDKQEAPSHPKASTEVNDQRQFAPTDQGQFDDQVNDLRYQSQRQDQYQGHAQAEAPLPDGYEWRETGFGIPDENVRLEAPAVAQDSKPFWKSKILWTQLLTVVFSLFAMFGINLPQEYQHIATEVVLGLLSGSSLLTIVFRLFFTNTGSLFGLKGKLFGSKGVS